MSALREAFLDELRDLYDAENQLLEALPEMAEAAENEQLRAAFEEHREQTRGHVYRLGQVFEAFEEEARGKKCKGMAGLIKEAEELIEEEEGDAALIAAAQKAEHYEIAAYGTLAAWAVALGQEEAAQILTGTLEEEKETDHKLTMIAQSVVNSQESQRNSEEGEQGRQEKEEGEGATRRRAGSQRRSQIRGGPRARSARASGRGTIAKRTNSRRGNAKRTNARGMNQSSRSPRSKRLMVGGRKASK
jgi:ferritin-like metal-binding protein YciE